MARERRFGSGAALLAAALFGSSAWAAPPEREPEAREAVGVFPIEGESLLVVIGVPGNVAVTSRDAREVRFSSRATDRSGTQRPLGVWFEGSTVTIAPAPGETPPDGILRVEVPAGFAVRVEATGGTTTVDGMGGYVTVRAKDTDVKCRSTTGTLEVEVERGSLSLDQVAGASIRAKDATVTATAIRGSLVARIEGTTKLTATEIAGELDLDSEGGTFKVQGVGQGVGIKARGGTGELIGLEAGGELRLTACPITLSDGKGDITINSDAAVAFTKMAASLHLDLYGGSLRGSINQGLVEVRTRGTEILLEGIDGPVRISGDDLKVDLSGVGGDLYVESTGSQVTIAKAGAAVALKLQGGNVVVNGAQGLLSATIVDGDAQFLDLTGPVALEIDGGNAEVSWTSITGETDTLLRSHRGDVTVRFPPGASCRVEAVTRIGRVESDLPTVRVLEDGKEAQGPVGHGRRPTIKVQAEGDVRLTGGVGGAPPPTE